MRKSGILLPLLGLLFSVYATNLHAQFIFTKAGTGNPGDYLTATAAAIGNPTAVAVDASGNLYIASQYYRVRKVSALDGKIRTVAGNGTYGYSGDGGAATSAALSSITGLALDAAGNLYIADQGNNRIRKISASDGKISTVAGNGTAGYSGDGGAAAAASLKQPYGVAVDASGNLYIADQGNHRIRKVNAADGKISTIAGSGTAGFANGTGVAAFFNSPAGIIAYGTDNLYIADYGNHRIRRLVISTGVVSTVAGNGTASFAGDGGAATLASLKSPSAVSVDASGNLYIADQGNTRIRKVTTSDGKIATIAGNGTFAYSGDGGAATAASLNSPYGVAVDAAGNVFIADFNNFRVRKLTAADGKMATAAGNGTGNFAGEGVPANIASLYSPTDVAVDASGNLYIADQGNNRIRKVSASDGKISTVAGNGTYGSTGDGGAATAATLSMPTGIAVDAGGNLYIADQGNSRIRKINAVDGVITTVAGNGISTFSGDGGDATAASLYFPMDVVVDASGNLYIADRDNNRIRKVSAADGKISTVAGNGTAGYSGDGGAATAASLNQPTSVALDASGNLYIADRVNSRIRKVNAADGTISTVVGSGIAGYGSDGENATATSLFYPRGVFVDGSGNIYISDQSNRVRKASAADGKVYTLAGNGTSGYSGDGIAATTSSLYSPMGLAMDAAGNLYIADFDNYRVRYVCAATSLATVSGTDLRTVFPEQNKSLAFGKDCALHVGLIPGGTKPVAGNIADTVWLEPTVPTTTNGKPYVQRHYGITPEDNASTSTGTVTLYFTQAEFDAYNAHPAHGPNLPLDATDAVNNKANLRITKKSGTSNNGTGLYNTYSGAAEVIIPTSVTWDATLNAWAVTFDVAGFSGFFLSTSAYVLPVSFETFSARLQGNDARLDWQTTDEENTLAFEVQRATDGANFATVGTIKSGPGSPNNYGFLDKGIASLDAPVVYYRIKTLNSTGSFTYSTVVPLSLNSRQATISVYPNPVQHNATLTIVAEKEEMLRYTILDAAGRIVLSKNRRITEGVNTISLETSKVLPGIYTLVIRGSRTNSETSFVKLP